MTVYVDDMRMEASVPNGNRTVTGRWSHLFADTIEELETFARQLGLRESWLQTSNGGLPHYDLVDSRRLMAIRLGAQPVSYHDDLPRLLRTVELVLRKSDR